MAELVDLLRRCVISLKVAGSIPDGVFSIFYLLGCKGGRCLRLTTLPLSCAYCLEILEPHSTGTIINLLRPEFYI